MSQRDVAETTNLWYVMTPFLQRLLMVITL